jgi:hypothetical protein
VLNGLDANYDGNNYRYTICADSSIIDAMSECPKNEKRYTSQTDKPPILSRETGTMRFKVEDESSKDNLTYNIEKKGDLLYFQVDGTLKINGDNYKVNKRALDIFDKKKTFQADMVYRHVVNQVIIEMDKIRSDGRYLKEFMKAEGSNLFDKLANYKSGDKRLNPMMNILEKTCVKSFGDWFQEVNGVVEDGGYILDNSYRSSNNVLSHKSRNPLRLVVSNDRPSAVRIFHMLTFAKSGINPNAYGGYLPSKPTGGKVKELNNTIILRKSNEKIRESRNKDSEKIKIRNQSYSEQYKNKMKRLRSSSGLNSSLQPRRKKGGNKKIKKTRKINGGRTNRKTRKK